MKNKNLEKYQNELIESLSKIAFDKVLLREFIVDLLTPKELEEIPLRWQIVKRLAAGETHRGIAEDLGVGVATVTRGSSELRNQDGGFRLALKKLKK